MSIKDRFLIAINEILVMVDFVALDDTELGSCGQLTNLSDNVGS